MPAQQTKKTADKPLTREESVLAELRELEISAKKAKEFITAESGRSQTTVDKLKTTHGDTSNRWIRRTNGSKKPLPSSIRCSATILKLIRRQKIKIRYLTTNFEQEQSHKYRQAITELIAKLKTVEIPGLSISPIENNLLEMLTEINFDDATTEMIHLQELFDDLNE